MPLPYSLSHTLTYGPPVAAGLAWWGPWFPPSWFGPWFPDGRADPGVVQPSSPGGAATFLLLESGSRLTYSWGEDSLNRKMWSGAEYRTSMLDDPKRTFVGTATLLGDQTRAMRAALARYIAIGSTFLLALPFEAISIRADSTGVVVPTTDTTLSDWMQVGQRVAVLGVDGSTADAVIQSFTSNSVTLDIEPDTIGRAGGQIMPTVPVFFDPQMQTARYRGTNAVERWQLNARAAVFGYPITERAAFVALTAATGALAGVVLRYPTVGTAGNALTFRSLGDKTAVDPCTLTVVGSAYTFHYCPGTHTFTDFILTVFTAGEPFDIFGTYNIADVLTAGDAIGPVQFHDGADTGYGAMGRGATVTTYDTRPVWDIGEQMQDTASDSVQSLAELVDLGGIPISIGTAKQADWGRALYLERTDREDWQWLKAFLAAVRGPQRAFWLASMRPDLVPVGFSGLDLVIEGPSDADGGLDAWWPTQRDRIQVTQADGNVVYAQIQAAVDNLDGTLTLTLGYDGSAPTIAAVTMVSWLELCRMDDTSVDVAFTGASFQMSATARVVQQ